MKKIYIFYLYGNKDELTEYNYPGISGFDVTQGNRFYHVLYAWTNNKFLRRSFKQQRDMNLFKEVVHEIPNNEFDKFSDEYSDAFLEERAITTKGFNKSNRIIQKICYILTTKNELDYMVENQQYITRNQLKCLIEHDIYIREKYFSDEYRKILNFFAFDDIMSYSYPMDECDIPFKVITDDNLAIYSHLYHNTYRKELSEL